MILLDTCTLLYATLEPKRLSKKAAAACERGWADGAAYCSASMFEVGWKARSGKLDLGMSFIEWRDRLCSLESLRALPVHEPIWLAAVQLDWSHKDPIDRLIVATASDGRMPLVTEDRAIRDFYARSVW